MLARLCIIPVESHPDPQLAACMTHKLHCSLPSINQDPLPYFKSLEHLSHFVQTRLDGTLFLDRLPQRQGCTGNTYSPAFYNLNEQLIGCYDSRPHFRLRLNWFALFDWEGPHHNLSMQALQQPGLSLDLESRDPTVFSTESIAK